MLSVVLTAIIAELRLESLQSFRVQDFETIKSTNANETASEIFPIMTKTKYLLE